MVAEAVKKTVGVGGHTGGGERDQGAKRRRLTLQWNFDEGVAIHVRVEGWIVFNQVTGRLDRDSLGSTGYLKDQLQIGSDGRSNLNISTKHAETRGRDHDLIWIEWNVGEDELSSSVACHGSIESTGRIGQVHSRAGNYRAAGVSDGAAHRTGIAALRRGAEGRKNEGE